MDLDMPVFDGIKTTSMLKDESQTKNIPIVLFTNTDLSIEAEKAMKEIGVTSYISKAADQEKFIDLIKAALVKSSPVVSKV
jgi:CheY-like chemotaxis protein